MCALKIIRSAAMALITFFRGVRPLESVAICARALQFFGGHMTNFSSRFH